MQLTLSFFLLLFLRILPLGLSRPVPTANALYRVDPGESKHPGLLRIRGNGGSGSGSRTTSGGKRPSRGKPGTTRPAKELSLHQSLEAGRNFEYHGYDVTPKQRLRYRELDGAAETVWQVKFRPKGSDDWHEEKEGLIEISNHPDFLGGIRVQQDIESLSDNVASVRRIVITHDDDGPTEYAVLEDYHIAIHDWIEDEEVQALSSKSFSREAVDLLLGTIDVLEKMHNRNYVHRGITADTIGMTSGKGMTAIVSGFGIAKSEEFTKEVSANLVSVSYSPIGTFV